MEEWGQGFAATMEPHLANAHWGILLLIQTISTAAVDQIPHSSVMLAGRVPISNLWNFRKLIGQNPITSILSLEMLRTAKNIAC